MTLKEIREKLGQLNADARKIIDAADARSGGPKQGTLTNEESGKVDEIYAEYDNLKAQADSMEKAEKQRLRLAEHDDYMNQSAGRRTENGPLSPPNSGNDGQPLVLKFRGRELTVRAGTPEHQRAATGYRDQFADYIMTGRPSSGLQVSADPKGGYLASTTMVASLIKFLDDQVWMRRLATVLPPIPSSVSLGAPSWDADPGDADWTAEVPASDISEDDTATVGKREMVPHLLTKLVKASMKLLRTGVIDIESFIAERLAYKFGVTEEKAFLTGNGSKRPLGVFIASNDGVPTSRDVTCVGTTAFTADEIIDLLYQLKAQYRNNATGLFHRDAVKRIRKLKDGSGQYLWQPGLNGNEQATVLGRPIVESEHAPNTFTTGLYVGMFADFKAGYWIADSMQLEVQRLGELFALKNQVGLLARKETDGMPVLSEAFSRLKLA